MSKQVACINALEKLPDKGLIGIGSGSTIMQFLKLINNKSLRVVCASSKVEDEARRLGFKVTNYPKKIIPISFDGADYFDRDNNLIKGRGRALLKEKVIDYNSKKVIIIAEKKKLTNTFNGLGIPVEVHPFSTELVKNQLSRLGADVKLMNGFTENNNKLLTAAFKRVINPSRLEAMIKSLPGVMEAGLFTKANVELITD